MHRDIANEKRAIDAAIGRRVRIARGLLDMSQEKLAEAVGVTFQQVQKYEKGTNRISGSRMVQIAGALQQDVRWFFADVDPVQTLDDGKRGRDVVSQMLAVPLGLALAKAFSALPQTQRAIVVSVAQAMAPAPQGGA